MDLYGHINTTISFECKSKYIPLHEAILKKKMAEPKGSAILLIMNQTTLGYQESISGSEISFIGSVSTVRLAGGASPFSTHWTRYSKARRA